MANRDSAIAIYYEHPDWFRPLFAELDRRGMPYVCVDASQHSYRSAASYQSSNGGGMSPAALRSCSYAFRA